MTFHMTPGQKKHLYRLKVRGFVADHGVSWWDSVVYGWRAYRHHRQMIEEYQAAEHNDGCQGSAKPDQSDGSDGDG